MQRSRLMMWVSGVSRGFRGWRFAAFALTTLTAYNLFVLVTLFAPTPDAELQEFADNFRQWCFGYEAGSANIHYVINYFVGPVLLSALILGVWGRDLKTAAVRKPRALLAPASAALALALAAGGLLLWMKGSAGLQDLARLGRAGWAYALCSGIGMLFFVGALKSTSIAHVAI
ncbi:MAG TPA: hypothetical protein PLF37_15405, partial [Planctomycetota bacterium]|nr:hypothetical protein [Planctomycetota bacterium]